MSVDQAIAVSRADDALNDACALHAAALMRANLGTHGFLAAAPGAHAQKRGYDRVFGRDAAICAIAAAACGDEDLLAGAERSLVTLATHQAPNGQIPKYVDPASDSADFWYLGCIDATLWWLIAVDHVTRRSPALRLQLEAPVVQALAWLNCQEHQQLYLLQQNEASDWADIMPRSGFVLYTNALWYHVKCLYRLPHVDQTHAHFNALFHPFGRERPDYKRLRLLMHFVRNKAHNSALYLSFVNLGFWGEEGDIFGNLLAILFGLADEHRSNRILAAVEANQTGAAYPVRVTARCRRRHGLQPVIHKMRRDPEPDQRGVGDLAIDGAVVGDQHAQACETSPSVATLVTAAGARSGRPSPRRAMTRCRSWRCTGQARASSATVPTRSATGSLSPARTRIASPSRASEAPCLPRSMSGAAMTRETSAAIVCGSAAMSVTCSPAAERLAAMASAVWRSGVAIRARSASVGRVASDASLTPEASGSENENTLPTPTWLVTVSVPPIASTSWRAIDRPRPVPPKWRVGRLLGLRKGIEDAVELVGGDADAGILDAEAQPVGAIHGEPERHAAGLGELQRVVDEVAQHLAEADRVGRDPCPLRHRHGGAEVDGLGAGAVAEEPQHIAGTFLGIDGQMLDGELAGLDLREIEDVVDDGQQAGARARDDLRLPARPLRQFGRRQKFGHDHDAVHRRADLVAHRRQEGGFRLVGVVGRLRRLQVVRRPVGDLDLELLAMPLEPGVALADLAQHAVEPVDEAADLVAPALGQRNRVVMRAAHLRHRARQRPQALADAALEPDRQGDGRQHRQAADDQDREHRRGDQRRQVAGVAEHPQRADRLAFEDHRHRRLDRAAAQDRRERPDGVGPGDDEIARQLLRRPDIGQRGAVARLDAGEGDARDAPDRPDRLVGARDVALRHRLRRCGRDRMRAGQQRVASGDGIASRPRARRRPP